MNKFTPNEYFEKREKAKIITGDCLDIMQRATPNSVDAIVTDPPYGLSFMGKKWDYDVPSVEIWKEAYRVLKPGGYLLSFAGTRTQHRMAVNIEDAGFEIRDMIAWVYGSGFPKSLNIGKAIDRQAGELKPENKGFTVAGFSHNDKLLTTAPSKGYVQPTLKTDEAKQWEGWGTALKPALEPITVARKPLSEKTVAENVLKWGTGGINIDGSRVGIDKDDDIHAKNPHTVHIKSNLEFTSSNGEAYKVPQGRFPANLIHDGSDEVVRGFPSDKPDKSPARFFYCAKASKSERNRGCEGMEGRFAPTMNNGIGVKEHDPETATKKNNFHPTVKPISLMEYLVKLVSKEGHTILDPFMGSGTTGIACKRLNRVFVGIEREPEYVEIAKARMEK